ncbi:MAG: hypothetical protein QXI48_07725 [Candidatus Bathyarchaeia archaeon]
MIFYVVDSYFVGWDGIVFKSERNQTSLEAKYYTLTKKGLREALKNTDWTKIPLEKFGQAMSKGETLS